MTPMGSPVEAFCCQAPVADRQQGLHGPMVQLLILQPNETPCQSPAPARSGLDWSCDQEEEDDDG